MRQVVATEIPNSAFDNAVQVPNLGPALDGIYGNVIEVEDGPDGDDGVLIYVPGVGLDDILPLDDDTDGAAV